MTKVKSLLRGADRRFVQGSLCFAGLTLAFFAFLLFVFQAMPVQAALSLACASLSVLRLSLAKDDMLTKSYRDFLWGWRVPMFDLANISPALSLLLFAWCVALILV